MAQSLYCFECTHYLGEGKCLAFPKKIPEEIITGEELHDKTRKDQKGDFIHVQIKPI